MIPPQVRPTWLTLVMMALAVLLVTGALPAMAADGPQHAAKASKSPRSGSQKRAKKRAKKRKRIKRKKPKHRQGLYVVLGLGAASIDENISRYDYNAAFKGQIGLGYRFNKSLALEGNGLLLATNLEDTRNGEQDESTSLAGGHLSLKYYIPISPPRVESYLQGGLGYVVSPEFPDGQDPIGATILDLGAGVEFRTSDWFAIGVRGGYMTAVQEQNDVDVSALSWMITLQFELEPTKKRRKKKKKKKKRTPKPRY